MKLTTLVEITRIRQEVREADVALETTHITSPEDAFLVAKRFIQDDDREVFLVILLNTKNRVIVVHRAHVGSIKSTHVKYLSPLSSTMQRHSSASERGPETVPR